MPIHHQAHAKNAYEQVSGMFSSPMDFTNLIEALHQRGYKEDDLSILMSENTRNEYFTTAGGREEYFAPKENTKASEGATVGGISGGILGILIGSLTLVGSVIVPGAGILVAGPLVGALTAGAVGAAAGGLIGGLVGAGIPEHEAKFFEDALKEKGRILVVAHVPKEAAKEVKAVFERHNASQLRSYSCSVPG